jgi:metal-responsive CopG/Arc/MetJ family transcriptional regulator
MHRILHHDARLRSVRTTVSLDDDVAAAVDRVRRERSVGLSEAVNDLIRAGLRARPEGPKRVRMRRHDLGLKVDVTNVAEAIEILDGPAAR